MKYAIHFHKQSYPNAKREHIGYVDSYGSIMLHGQTVKYRAGIFTSQKQAFDWISQNSERFEEYTGMILIEPFPESKQEEIEAIQYLQFCHKYNVNFI